MNSVKKWSKFQDAIFDFVENGQGNAIIKAVAGSGKTTTIAEAVSRVKGTSIFLAFNKSIADELKSRGVNARTFHSVTYSPTLRAKGVNAVDANKLDRIAKANLNGKDFGIYGSFIIRLVGLARQTGIGCLVPNKRSAWEDLVEHHDLELESDEANSSTAIDLACKLLEWSNADKSVDFDDLLYVPVKDGISLSKFDFVFVDEAQDTNAIQRALIRKLLRKGGRVVAVGDPAQAIYGFRGADSNSMDLIAEEFNTTELPLSISYRCPKKVVEYARAWVNHIEYADGAEEGEVNQIGTAWKNEQFQALDLVVCRTTAPVIKLAYRLIRDKIPAQVMGRNIGEGLKSFITKRLKAQSIDHLMTVMSSYRDREVERNIAAGKDAKAEAINDQCSAIEVIVEGLSEDSRTISHLLEIIDTLFADKKSAVLLSTIHKAKGLEADRVWWLNRSQCPALWVKKDWQKQQENNLCYVATTRAHKVLNLIDF